VLFLYNRGCSYLYESLVVFMQSKYVDVMAVARQLLLLAGVAPMTYGRLSEYGMHLFIVVCLCLPSL